METSNERSHSRDTKMDQFEAQMSAHVQLNFVRGTNSAINYPNQKVLKVHQQLLASSVRGSFSQPFIHSYDRIQDNEHFPLLIPT